MIRRTASFHKWPNKKLLYYAYTQLYAIYAVCYSCSHEHINALARLVLNNIHLFILFCLTLFIGFGEERML